MIRHQYYNGALYRVETDIAGPASPHTVLRKQRGIAVQIWLYQPSLESHKRDGIQFPARYTYAFLPS